MRFDIHFRDDVADKIRGVVADIQSWNAGDPSARGELAALADHFVRFEHCSVPDRPFLIGGADGSGDFPCARYGDSSVYLVTAMSRLYEAGAGGLSELSTGAEDVADFLWVPEDRATARERFLRVFSSLMGAPLEEVCRESDYFEYARRSGKAASSPGELPGTLLLPASHDASNIAIQLRSTAESGALTRLMRSVDTARYPDMPIYLLENTTLALPMVGAKSTLFFEVAKRYVCEYARKHGFFYMALSKSHNMPLMDLIESEAAKKAPSGEHWFFRVPAKSLGETAPEFLGTRTIPPVGAVSYVFKLHNTTQPMRLDMGLEQWRRFIYSEDGDEQLRRETQLFRDLDFASHDQRCYGCPYPIKACHDGAGLTEAERGAVRKRLVDEAVAAGLKRKYFVDPGATAGHK